MLKKSLFFSNNFKITLVTTIGFLVTTATFTTFTSSAKSNSWTSSYLYEQLKILFSRLNKGLSNTTSSENNLWTKSGLVSNGFSNLKEFLNQGFNLVKKTPNNIVNGSKVIWNYLKYGFQQVKNWGKGAWDEWILQPLEVSKKWGNKTIWVITDLLFPWSKTIFKTAKTTDFGPFFKHITKSWDNFKTTFVETAKFVKKYQFQLAGLTDEQREALLKKFLEAPEKFLKNLKELNEFTGSISKEAINFILSSEEEQAKKYLEMVKRGVNIKNVIDNTVEETGKAVKEILKIVEGDNSPAQKAITKIAENTKKLTTALVNLGIQWFF